MAWKKGQSGNPGGRPKLDPAVRQAILANGVKAAERMAELLGDDEAWGKNGWMKPREQILLASLAQERAFGKPMDLSVEHIHAGTIELRPRPVPVRPDLRQFQDDLPERKAQQQIIDAKRSPPA